MGINIGFTGTREGMTLAQKHQLQLILHEYVSIYDAVYFHEGEGRDRRSGPESSDLQAKAIAQRLGCIIVEHPPHDNTARELLARDDIIVARSTFLIAAPGTFQEIIRGSGTWYTVRRGRAAQREGCIIWPCGCRDLGLSFTEHEEF